MYLLITDDAEVSIACSRADDWLIDLFFASISFKKIENKWDK